MNRSFKLHYKPAGFFYTLIFGLFPKFSVSIKSNGSLYTYRYVLLFGKFLFLYDALIFDLPETRVSLYSDVEGNA